MQPRSIISVQSLGVSMWYLYVKPPSERDYFRASNPCNDAIVLKNASAPL